MNTPRPFPLGTLHMSSIPAFGQAFKPFKDGGCEFIYGSPPNDNQCNNPAAYEINSTLVGGRSSGGRYLVCEHHKDELFKYVKELGEHATIKKLT
jgi:hypothetical protein